MAEKKSYHRFSYSDQALLDAINSVQHNHISINKAAIKHGIPKSTLAKKIKDKNPLDRKMGPDTVLSEEEELLIEEWILAKAALGFPMHPDEVKLAVQKILIAEKRPNPFPNSRPGRTWLKLYLQRRPAIKLKNAEVISKARAAVTEGGIRMWFAELLKYLTKVGALDILQEPKRILNLDETGVATCPKSGKLLGPRKEKNFYRISNNSEKECITVLCTFHADGDTIDPMILFPYQRIPRDIIASVPEGISVGRSDSGWMTSATYYEFIANILYPRLVEKEVKFPVLLLFDGHKSHLNRELHNFCVEKGILLFCLYPNATHILQPCDVGIFKPLKTAWKKIVQSKTQATTAAITKLEFAPLFYEAFTQITAETVINSFAACGIFPFNPDNVDYSKCISTRRENLKNPTLKDEVEEPINLNEKLLGLLDSMIPNYLLDQFDLNYDAGTSPEEEKLLFQIWKNLKEADETQSDGPREDLSKSDTHDISSEVVEPYAGGQLIDNFDGNNNDDCVFVCELEIPIDEATELSGTALPEVLQTFSADSSVTPHCVSTERREFVLEDEANNNSSAVDGNACRDDDNGFRHMQFVDSNGNVSLAQNQDPQESPLSTMTVSNELEKQKSSKAAIWKEHLHYPKIDPSVKKNRKEKEKPIYAITSTEWKERDMAKLQAELEEKKLKQKRLEQRQLRKEEAEKEKAEKESRKQERLRVKEEKEKEKAEKQRLKQEKAAKMKAAENVATNKRSRGRPRKIVENSSRDLELED